MRPPQLRAPAAVGAPDRGFGDGNVLVREGGDLGQVGHHQDLHVPGQHGQPAADLDGGAPSHADQQVDAERARELAQGAVLHRRDGPELEHLAEDSHSPVVTRLHGHHRQGTGQRFRVRVVRIVDDRQPSRACNLAAPRDRLERRRALDDVAKRHVEADRNGRGGENVGEVRLSRQRRAHFCFANRRLDQCFSPVDTEIAHGQRRRATRDAIYFRFRDVGNDPDGTPSVALRDDQADQDFLAATVNMIAAVRREKRNPTRDEQAAVAWAYRLLDRGVQMPAAYRGIGASRSAIFEPSI